MNRKRIDRDDELKLIHDVRSGKTKERILLISAGGGWGKSDLLREFIAEHPNDIPPAIVDFKDKGLSLAQLLCNICDTFDWSRFPALSEVIKTFAAQSTVNVTGNVMVGQNRIDAVMGGLDEQTREMRREELTKAFFHDVRSIGSVTIVFDVFDECESSIETWMVNSFLPYAHRSPQLTVVVAGRKVPQSSLKWEAIHHELRGIAFEHWKQHAEDLGLPASADLIQGCCLTCEGQPLKMLQIFSSLQSQAR
jgi:hypothetical protein